MGKARDLARVIVDSSGLIAAGNLGNAVPADGSITNAKIASVAASKLTGQVPDANAPSGSVLQVVTNFNNTPSVVSGSTYVDILTASITPFSATSKILVIFALSAKGDGSYDRQECQLFRNGTAIFQGGSVGSASPQSGKVIGGIGGSQLATQGAPFLDSPNTTSSVTYKLSVRDGDNGSGVSVYINRSDDTGGNCITAPSSIILMEISS